MPKRPTDLPEIPDADVFQRFQDLNPAYADTPQRPDPRAAEDLNEMAGDHEALITVVRARVEQMLGNHVWMDQRGSSDQEFKKAPRTFAKTAQEILTHPTDRVVFRRGGDIYDLSSIIVDPRRVTDTLLKNLGLDEAVPPKKANRAEQLSQRAEAIPDVKRALADLEPIRFPGRESDSDELKYFRLMRVGDGVNEGYIVGTQHIEGKKILFKTDLYGAGRRLTHIEESYVEEIRKLKWLEMTLREISEKFGKWAAIKNTEELDAVKNALLKCVDSLEFVRNDHKGNLRRRINRCLQLKGANGRLNNPGATRASIQGTMNDLGARHTEIERIWSYIARDKARMHGLIEDQEAPFNQFAAEVRKLHEQFRILRSDTPLDEENKQRIITNLRARQENASDLMYEPYLSFGKKFSEQIGNVIAALENGDTEKAGAEFVKVFLITKLVESHNDLQGVYEDLSLQPDKLHPEALWADLQVINDRLSKKEVAPEIVTADYDAAYGEVYHLFNSLQKRLRELEAGEVAATGKVSEDDGGTLDEILAELTETAPDLTGFVERLRKRLVLRSEKESEAPAGTELPAYTEAQKLAVFKTMKERLGGFDFRELIMSLNGDTEEEAST